MKNEKPSQATEALIVAAPEMLDALINLIDAVYYRDDDDDLILAMSADELEEIKTLIRKAKGT